MPELRPEAAFGTAVKCSSGGKCQIFISVNTDLVHFVAPEVSSHTDLLIC